MWMSHSDVVIKSPEFHSSSSISFPARGKYDLLFKVDIVNPLLKTIVERQKT